MHISLFGSPFPTNLYCPAPFSCRSRRISAPLLFFLFPPRPAVFQTCPQPTSPLLTFSLLSSHAIPSTPSHPRPPVPGSRAAALPPACSSPSAPSAQLHPLCTIPPAPLCAGFPPRPFPALGLAHTRPKGPGQPPGPGSPRRSGSRARDHEDAVAGSRGHRPRGLGCGGAGAGAGGGGGGGATVGDHSAPAACRRVRPLASRQARRLIGPAGPAGSSAPPASSARGPARDCKAPWGTRGRRETRPAPAPPGSSRGRVGHMRSPAPRQGPRTVRGGYDLPGH